MAVPVTSVSLLKVLGEDAQSPRWTEFAKKYASTIDGYLLKEFPDVDKDEVVNDTLIVLTKKLPFYKYDPDTKGHLRNYLLGIVKWKAREQRKKLDRDKKRKVAIKAKIKFELECKKKSYSVNSRNWQKEAFEVARVQFMANPNLNPRDKEIFRRIVFCKESPADVAAIFGITRNNVDQIKARMMTKFKELALKYAGICDS